MALNKEQREDLLEAVAYTEFPVVVVFTSKGLSSWTPELVMSKEALVDYLDSDECPDWNENWLGGLTGTTLINAYEYAHEFVGAPKYFAAIDETIDECICEHCDFDEYVSGAGWIWVDESTLKPEEWDEED